jgi:hypothetical protein
MPLLTDHEDTNRYTAPPDNEPDPNEYQAAHIIPDHDRDYDLEEVIQILEYAIEYIRDENIGIDTL